MSNQSLHLIAAALGVILVSTATADVAGDRWRSAAEDTMSDAENEREWLREQRALLADYFHAEGIRPPGNLNVAFSLPPMLALWSEPLPDGTRQIWAISGDCPTDFLIFDKVLDARAAMSRFAAHWMDVSSLMKRGQQHPTTRIGNPQNPKELQELGTMLESRARMLQSWSQR